MDRPADAAPPVDGPRWIPTTVVVVAALLALGTSATALLAPTGAIRGPIPSWRAWRTGANHPARLADEELGPLRAALQPRARVGYLSPLGQAALIAREPDVQRFYSTQYALAPTPLKLIYLPECLARGSWACGLERVDVLVAPAAATAPAAALGLAPVLSAGGMTLLSRGAR